MRCTNARSSSFSDLNSFPWKSGLAAASISVAIIFILVLPGCHPWHQFRSAANHDTNQQTAWDEESVPGDPGTEEWTDDFSAAGSYAHKKRTTVARETVTSPNEGSNDDDTASDARQSEQVASRGKPRASTVSDKDEATGSPAVTELTDPDEPTTTEFVITDEEASRDAMSEASKQSATRVATPVASDSTEPPDSIESNDDGAVVFTESNDEELDDDDISVDLDDRQLITELTNELGLETNVSVTASHSSSDTNALLVPADLNLPLDLEEAVVPSRKNPMPTTTSVSDNESGFFRHIFIDRPGASNKRATTGTSKDYTEIRRLFQHPDVSTQYRSHSRFSLQFQRPSNNN